MRFLSGMASGLRCPIIPMVRMAYGCPKRTPIWCICSMMKKITKDIEMAKNESDFVIVFVHRGTEYAKEPDDFQRKWTQIFADCKVDVVVGTHPHVIQPYEVIRDNDGHEMLIYYSIGNYISAQPEESRVKGGMASFTVLLAPEGYKVTEYDFRPLTIRWQEGGKYVTEF